MLSLDMLIAARRRGFDAALVTGTAEAVRGELAEGRPAILMLRLLDAPGARRDVFHYVVVDGIDPPRGLFRFQFGDGKARWARLESLEDSWKPAGHALLVVRSRADTDAALARAVAFEGQGRLEDADALYRQVLVVRPESVRAWVNLGNVAADQGRREESETAYRRALEIAPDDRDALNNLAWLLLAEGIRLEEAETLATKAARQPGADRPLALTRSGGSSSPAACARTRPARLVRRSGWRPCPKRRKRACARACGRPRRAAGAEASQASRRHPFGDRAMCAGWLTPPAA